MITTQQEYNDLALAADMAEENLSSLRFGSHYLLMKNLRKHGVLATDRLDAIRQARKLCDEWLFAKEAA